METAERAAFFEAELAKFESGGQKFNIKAFIFSSFYFWYLGMSGMFAFFALLPIILTLLFLPVTKDMTAAFACGFVTAHIIAGFKAYPAYKKYMMSYLDAYKNFDGSARVSYLAISVWRLAACYILSGGLYVLYWGRFCEGC